MKPEINEELMGNQFLDINGYFEILGIYRTTLKNFERDIECEFPLTWEKVKQPRLYSKWGINLSTIKVGDEFNVIMKKWVSSSPVVLLYINTVRFRVTGIDDKCIKFIEIDNNVIKRDLSPVYGKRR